jgi:hypothetical protein
MDWCDNFLTVDLMLDPCDRLNTERTTRSAREPLYEAKVIEVGVVARCCLARLVDLVETDYAAGTGGRELLEGALVDLGMEIGWRRADCLILHRASRGVRARAHGRERL